MASSSSLLAGLDQPASEAASETTSESASNLVNTSATSPTSSPPPPPHLASSASQSTPPPTTIPVPPSLSLDSIPSASQALQDLSVATPRIHQQELILSSLSHTAAASAVSDDDDDVVGEGGSVGHHRSATSIKAPIQDKGTGWALLSHSRSSSVSSPRQTSVASFATASFTNARGRSTTSRPLVSTSPSQGQVPPPRPSSSTSRSSSMVLDHVSSASTPGTPTSSSAAPNINAGATAFSSATIDCDTPSRKVKAVDQGVASGHSHAQSHSHSHSHSHSRPTARRLTNSMELPAEGAGLRGKDENKMVVDEEEEERGREGVTGADATVLAAAAPHNPLDPPPARKLCIRHQRMADEGTVGKLQRSIESLPLPDQQAVNSVWSIFSSSSHARRALILQGILSMCCFSQLSLLSSELALAIRIDPFSLFPREVSLKVLGHLDAISLGRAAQVSRAWRTLADDDLLWRNMCEQHIERKCEKCGWGLPLLSEKRRRVKGTMPLAGTPESRQLTYTNGSGEARDPRRSGSAESSTSSLNAIPSTSAAAGSATGNLKRSITAAANAAALERHSRTGTADNSPAASPAAEAQADAGEALAPPKKRHCNEASREGSSEPKASSAVAAIAKTASDAGATSLPVPSSSSSPPTVPATRPWKTVYCERLAIERNWRRGRYTVRQLKGHTDGIMCLQFNEALAHPSFPVCITGSYDRTARIWNMDTGEELRVLRGHTRGVRCLQFDEAKLITGSMDRTLKIWNWRTGNLIRTLEGHTEGIVCLNFNDHLLASGSADSNIKIWNFKTGQCHTLMGHSDWVNAVVLWSGTQPKTRAANSDGAENTFLFSASDDGTIRLWDLAHKECLMVFTGHVGQCQGLSLVQMPEEVVEALAGGGNVGSSGAEAGARHDQQQQPQRPHDPTNFMHPDNQANIAASQQSSPTAGGQSCGYNPPAVRGGRSANTGTAPGIPEHFYSTSTTPASTSRDSHRLRIDPKLVKLQERLQAAGLVDALPIDAEMGDLEWGAGKRAAQQSHASSQHARVSPNRNGEAGNTANGNGSSTPSASSSHQKLRPMLFSCSLDNTIKIWDVRTGVCVRTLFGHMAGLWALSTDRLRLATASHDATLKVWELATGKHLFSICEHRGPVTCVQIGDDKAVSGSDDGNVNIYSFASGTSAA